MKKIGFLLACMLLGAPLALAQYTVTATVTDHPDGQTWNSGSYRIDFYPTAAAPQLPAGTQASYTGTLSSSGGLSQVLPQVTQNGASWKFTICPMASLVGACPSVVLPIQASGSVSTALSAMALSPRFPAGSASYGYTDAECIPPSLPGPGYFNVGSNSYRQWNGIAWQGSGGGGVTSFANRTGAVVPASGDYASYYLGLGGGTLSGNLGFSSSLASAEVNFLDSHTALVDGITWANFGYQIGLFGGPGNGIVAQFNNFGTISYIGLGTSGIILQAAKAGGYIGWGAGLPGNLLPAYGSFYNPAAGVIDCNLAASDTHDCTFRAGTLQATALVQTAASSMGGTCAMAAATSCTITLGHTYTTPVCIVTQQSATLTGGAVGCTVSGATATVTAAASNSETWGVLVFGNPS